jgi:hypothetical protein
VIIDILTTGVARIGPATAVPGSAVAHQALRSLVGMDSPPPSLGQALRDGKAMRAVACGVSNSASTSHAVQTGQLGQPQRNVVNGQRRASD